MKGQTQALTAVLITLITVGSISAAYIWGTPLLEKRESQSQLETVEQDVLSLQNAIISVSNSGSGTTREVTLNMEEGSLEINEEQDYIQIEVEASNPPYASNIWTIIEGNNMQNTTIVNTGDYGIKGDDLPGIVAVNVPSNSQPALVRYRIDFRNLLASQPSEIERIDLQTSAGSQSSGETTMLISNQGTESGSSIKIGSDRLNLKRKIIEIDIQ